MNILMYKYPTKDDPEIPFVCSQISTTSKMPTIFIQTYTKPIFLNVITLNTAKTPKPARTIYQLNLKTVLLEKNQVRDGWSSA